MVVEAGERPNGAQFAEGNETEQVFTVDNPIDLVGNIRALVNQERERRGEDFNAAMWLGDNLESLGNDAYFDSMASGVFALPAQEREIAEEKHKYLWGLRTAWYLRAYQEVDGENNYAVFSNIQGYCSAYQTRSITLSPVGVTLLDAMAEALDIPHTTGQSEFNVDPLLTGAIDKIMNSQNPMPTLQEVRQAITSRPENLIDADQ